MTRLRQRLRAAMLLAALGCVEAPRRITCAQDADCANPDLEECNQLTGRCQPRPLPLLRPNSLRGVFACPVLAQKPGTRPGSLPDPGSVLMVGHVNHPAVAGTGELPADGCVAAGAGCMDLSSSCYLSTPSTNRPLAPTDRQPLAQSDGEPGSYVLWFEQSGVSGPSKWLSLTIHKNLLRTGEGAVPETATATVYARVRKDDDAETVVLAVAVSGRLSLTRADAMPGGRIEGTLEIDLQPLPRSFYFGYPCRLPLRCKVSPEGPGQYCYDDDLISPDCVFGTFCGVPIDAVTGQASAFGQCTKSCRNDADCQTDDADGVCTFDGGYAISEQGPDLAPGLCNTRCRVHADCGDLAAAASPGQRTNFCISEPNGRATCRFRTGHSAIPYRDAGSDGFCDPVTNGGCGAQETCVWLRTTGWIPGVPSVGEDPDRAAPGLSTDQQHNDPNLADDDTFDAYCIRQNVVTRADGTQAHLAPYDPCTLPWDCAPGQQCTEGEVGKRFCNPLCHFQCDDATHACSKTDGDCPTNVLAGTTVRVPSKCEFLLRGSLDAGIHRKVFACSKPCQPLAPPGPQTQGCPGATVCYVARTDEYFTACAPPGTVGAPPQGIGTGTGGYLCDDPLGDCAPGTACLQPRTGRPAECVPICSSDVPSCPAGATCVPLPGLGQVFPSQAHPGMSYVGFCQPTP